MADENPIPIINNSRKISQIRGRDTITYHQEHSWLVMAQYNDKIAAYHNVAINLSAITGYAIAYSSSSAESLVYNELDTLVQTYELDELKKLAYVGKQNDYESIGYAIQMTQIGYNIVSYTHAYTIDQMMWQYFPSKSDIFNMTKHLYTESGENILTDRGKKIIV